ncbi:hypothetical protein CkaCkLH20_10253 [Colletotrichum karsti]|uniref:Uncharacterized protein n=1 Tax=Colletotrichum karsti TaxID=1095194 RepID=A0A9P6I053_9PEZI|nr:uncharacterized protein CkaCkLH20_10253 [Colletotrichum karsti]KAF9872426.1 hypothetical protein CkaCkLH20_10253 [Colletotrichum karsti]
MAPPAGLARWLAVFIVLSVNGFVALSRAIPLLLLLNFAVSAWLVGHFTVIWLILPFYMGNDLSSTGSSGLAAAGITILSLYAVILFFALGSCLVLWYRSFLLWWFESSRFPAAANTGLKTTMQWYYGFDFWFEARLDPSKTRRLDRTYADRGEYALLDHYCTWLWTPVCLQTIKPYLLVMVFVTVHQSFVLAVLAWSVSRRSWRNTTSAFSALAVFFPLLILWLKLTPFIRKWTMLAVQNRTAFEYRNFVHRRRRPTWRMAVWDGRHLRRYSATFNPWDLGDWKANCRAALGEHWWQWPLFWLQPTRVHRYGSYDGSDLPLGDRWLDFLATRHDPGIVSFGPTGDDNDDNNLDSDYDSDSSGGGSSVIELVGIRPAPEPAPLPAAVVRNRTTYSSEY